LQEGRSQRALELARQLYTSERTPANLDLLRNAYLARAAQLRSQGHSRDAITTLEAAQRLQDVDPAWFERVAAEMARAGGVAQALALMDRLPPDAPSRAAILQHLADGAVEQETTAHLPAELLADIAAVRTTFAQVERGDDDAARTSLQCIGLRSPLLEWKLLLRGLMAYYQNDDARALENWQRLNPERLPARLCAALRSRIDPSYRAAQPPSTQSALRTQLDRLQGSPLAQQIRLLRAAFVHGDSLRPAFRQAEALLPELRRHYPHLVGRLASCFYWAISETGPDDVPRYQRLFGPPPGDPNFHRLRALACDRAGDLKTAHQAWQDYDREIADHPDIWPYGQPERARAQIWLHMGMNADSVPSVDALRSAPPRVRRLVGTPRALKPTAEQCFQRAVGLAPDQLEAHRALFEYHLDHNHQAKAEKVGRKLVERFPEDVPALEKMAELLHEKGNHVESLALFQRAFQGNPLDRSLRLRISDAHRRLARDLILKDHFDEARANLDSARSLLDPDQQPIVLFVGAGCEYRAGNTERAEQLLDEARRHWPSSLDIAFRMTVESIRLKLDRSLKTHFEKELKEGFSRPANPTDALAVLQYLTALDKDVFHYTGEKTHRTKVLAFVNKTRTMDWQERPLMEVCDCFLSLGELTRARKFADRGQCRFHHNPYFPFFAASSYFQGRPGRMPFYIVRRLLEEAERLVRDWPADDRRERLVKDLKSRKEQLELLDPLGAHAMDFFRFDPFEDVEDEDLEDIGEMDD
jgi:tetratricopeptide (TPR) repeat protein